MKNKINIKIFINREEQIIFGVKIILDTNKTLSVEEYLNRIIPFLKDIINNLNKSDIQKTQLIIANNFISSTGNDEERVMHSKNDNRELMINDEADEKNFLIHVKIDIKIIQNR